MKFNVLEQKSITTLSCIKKYVGFSKSMSFKKIILGLFIFCLLGACSAPTAMLGPAYTLSSTGNVLQAGFSYGSSELVTKYTGKTPMENLQEVALENHKNIQKKTLESDDFYNLVNTRIKKTNLIFNSSIQ